MTTRTDAVGFSSLTRRRFIAVSAAAAGACTVRSSSSRAQSIQTYTWHGVALGANASLALQHHNEAEARTAIALCLAEVARLEAIFSLHRADSAISTLNTEGRLDQAPSDLCRLLTDALRLARESDGRFDPTIQPLWQCYADHFSNSPDDIVGPSAAVLARARDLVGWRGIEVSAGRIAFRRPGMAITLNGMAQGYITDRVGDLLRSSGFTNVLVNMGEQLALGPKWNGQSWTLQVADPSGTANGLATLDINGGAVATSSYTGQVFDASGRFSHIFDAQTGQCAKSWRSVTVLADSAARADGLSTAIAASPVGTTWASVLGSARALVQSEQDGGMRWL